MYFPITRPINRKKNSYATLLNITQVRRDLDPENIHKSNCQFILIANYFPSIFVDVDDDDVATGDTSMPFHLNLSLLLHTHGLCDIV